MPSETARAAANQRLRAWAKARPQVSVVPLAQFMHAVMTDGALKIHRVSIPAGKTRVFLQDDELHPNPRGAAVLSLGILDTFIASHPKIPATDVRWNVEEVDRRGYAAAQR